MLTAWEIKLNKNYCFITNICNKVCILCRFENVYKVNMKYKVFNKWLLFLFKNLILKKKKVYAKVLDVVISVKILKIKWIQTIFC